jgi:hypothetical protein
VDTAPLRQARAEADSVEGSSEEVDDQTHLVGRAVGRILEIICGILIELRP